MGLRARGAKRGGVYLLVYDCVGMRSAKCQL